MCYNKSVNRRGLPTVYHLSCHLRSVLSRRWFFLSHRSLSKGLFTHFTSFLWYRVGGAPDYRSDFHGDFLSDDGERPVTARKMWLAMWKEYTHISWRDSSMTVERHWRLGNRRATNLLPSGVIVARESLKLYE